MHAFETALNQLSDTPLLALVLAGAGLIAGSFIALLSSRMPHDEPVVMTRSRCRSCQASLGPGDLIPLLSYAFLRGRCRHCRTPIPPRYPLIEIAAALIGALSAWLAPEGTIMLTALFGWWLLLIAVIDLEHFWLPDQLTLPLALAGLVAAMTFAPEALEARVWGLVAGAGVLALLAWLYEKIRRREGLGGGDPRLLGAIGAWLGWQALPLVLLVASLAGLSLWLSRLIVRREGSLQDALPFGTFLALAAWLVWLWQPLSG
ncbi:MAG: prepilin peptidase [Brevundimonas sp.]|jgi:leader peptidase (prepilin peptidase) / N-methyltransferase|uniref:prepilin peptidase n=1 Tax=Brevundimonas sp. TaxID=1871086 RepID=UPI00391BB2AA